MKLMIDRREWLRGEGSKSSFLFRTEDAKSCCVGLYLRDLGVSEEELESQKSAGDLGPKIPGPARWLCGDNRHYIKSLIASQLYETNDDPNLDPEAREEIVRQLFARAGVEVDFVG